jgi:hypothetical protein
MTNSKGMLYQRRAYVAIDRFNVETSKEERKKRKRERIEKIKKKKFDFSYRKRDLRFDIFEGPPQSCMV